MQYSLSAKFDCNHLTSSRFSSQNDFNSLFFILTEILSFGNIKKLLKPSVWKLIVQPYISFVSVPWVMLPSRLGLLNTPTLLLQRIKSTIPMSILDIIQNNLMVKFQWCWSFGECRAPLNCHCTQVYSGPEWYYLIGSNVWNKYNRLHTYAKLV